MTTTNSSTKWALAGVRVCAVYLAGLTPLSILGFRPFTGEPEEMKYVFAVGYLCIAIGLWLLRYWALQLTRLLLIIQLLVCVNALVTDKTLTALTLVGLTLFGLFALMALVHFSKPLVRALFNNPKSAIGNPKS